MSKRYQVVGSCALVTQDSPTGPVKLTLFRGAPIGPGAKDWEIEHNLSIGLIREIDDDMVPGVNAQGEAVVDPLDGVARPAKNAAKPILIAWVADNRGLTAADAEKLTAKNLWKLIDGEPIDATEDPDPEAELAELRKQAIAKGYGEDDVNKASAEDLQAIIA